MNKNLKIKYRQILENKLNNSILNEMAPASISWFKRLRHLFPGLKRFATKESFLEHVSRNFMGGDPLLGFHLRIRRGLNSVQDRLLKELQEQWGHILGQVEEVIITHEGAHILVIKGEPPKYYYLSPESGVDPVPMPPGWDPIKDDIPDYYNHNSWFDDPDYKSPFEGPLPGGGAGGAIVPGLGVGFDEIFGGQDELGNTPYGEPPPPVLPWWMIPGANPFGNQNVTSPVPRFGSEGGL